VTLFALSAVLVATVGMSLARYAKVLARRTGLGQALTGALLLGGSTSLSGITTSVTAAAGGHAELAASNAVGGIAAQTVFLAVADRVYSRANLEHAAASDENMIQGALLIALLALTLLAVNTPPVSVLGVHPMSILLLVAYGFGQRLVYRAQGHDMWRPRLTEFTQREDTGEGHAEQDRSRELGSERGPQQDGKHNRKREPDKERERNLAPNRKRDRHGDRADRWPLWRVWVMFGISAAFVGILGYVLANAGALLAQETGLNETVLGGLFTAISTSLPELVTAIAAVRIGALTLAVSDIVGGNAFDMIFLAVADVAFREGSLYHAMGTRPAFLLNLTVLMTAVLLLGLLRRQKHGLWNMGFESILLVLAYGAGFAVIVTTMG
jgi:cation:H+ antiporter